MSAPFVTTDKSAPGNLIKLKNVIPSFIKVRTLFINVKKNCRGLYFNTADLEMAAHFLHVLQEDKTLFSPSCRIKFIFHSLVFLGFFKSILIFFLSSVLKQTVSESTAIRFSWFTTTFTSNTDCVNTVKCFWYFCSEEIVSAAK